MSWASVRKVYLDTYGCHSTGQSGFQGAGSKTTHRIGKVIEKFDKPDTEEGVEELHKEQGDFKDYYNHFLNVNINFAAGPSWGIRTPYWAKGFEDLSHSANNFFKSYNEYAQVGTRNDNLHSESTEDCNSSLIYDAECLQKGESDESKCRHKQDNFGEEEEIDMFCGDRANAKGPCDDAPLASVSAREIPCDGCMAFPAIEYWALDTGGDGQEVLNTKYQENPCGSSLCDLGTTGLMALRFIKSSETPPVECPPDGKCKDNDDCLEEGEICIDGECVEPEEDDEADEEGEEIEEFDFNAPPWKPCGKEGDKYWCPPETPHCVNGKCKECRNAGHCPEGKICWRGRCITDPADLDIENADFTDDDEGNPDPFDDEDFGTDCDGPGDCPPGFKCLFGFCVDEDGGVLPDEEPLPFDDEDFGNDCEGHGDCPRGQRCVFGFCVGEAEEGPPPSPEPFEGGGFGSSGDDDPPIDSISSGGGGQVAVGTQDCVDSESVDSYYKKRRVNPPGELCWCGDYTCRGNCGGSLGEYGTGGTYTYGPGANGGYGVRGPGKRCYDACAFYRFNGSNYLKNSAVQGASMLEHPGDLSEATFVLCEPPEEDGIQPPAPTINRTIITNQYQYNSGGFTPTGMITRALSISTGEGGNKMSVHRGEQWFCHSGKDSEETAYGPTTHSGKCFSVEGDFTTGGEDEFENTICVRPPIDPATMQVVDENKIKDYHGVYQLLGSAEGDFKLQTLFHNEDGEGTKLKDSKVWRQTKSLDQILNNAEAHGEEYYIFMSANGIGKGFKTWVISQVNGGFPGALMSYMEDPLIEKNGTTAHPQSPVSQSIRESKWKSVFVDADGPDYVSYGDCDAVPGAGFIEGIHISFLMNIADGVLLVDQDPDEQVYDPVYQEATAPMTAYFGDNCEFPIQGVVTKGYLPCDDCDEKFHGEWGIFWKPCTDATAEGCDNNDDGLESDGFGSPLDKKQGFSFGAKQNMFNGELVLQQFDKSSSSKATVDYASKIPNISNGACISFDIIKSKIENGFIDNPIAEGIITKGSAIYSSGQISSFDGEWGIFNIAQTKTSESKILFAVNTTYGVFTEFINIDADKYYTVQFSISPNFSADGSAYDGGTCSISLSELRTNISRAQRNNYFSPSRYVEKTTKDFTYIGNIEQSQNKLFMGLNPSTDNSILGSSGEVFNVSSLTIHSGPKDSEIYETNVSGGRKIKDRSLNRSKRESLSNKTSLTEQESFHKEILDNIHEKEDLSLFDDSFSPASSTGTGISACFELLAQTAAFENYENIKQEINFYETIVSKGSYTPNSGSHLDFTKNFITKDDDIYNDFDIEWGVFFDSYQPFSSWGGAGKKLNIFFAVKTDEGLYYERAQLDCDSLYSCCFGVNPSTKTFGLRLLPASSCEESSSGSKRCSVSIYPPKSTMQNFEDAASYIGELKPTNEPMQIIPDLGSSTFWSNKFADWSVRNISFSKSPKCLCDVESFSMSSTIKDEDMFYPADKDFNATYKNGVCITAKIKRLFDPPCTTAAGIDSIPVNLISKGSVSQVGTSSKVTIDGEYSLFARTTCDSDSQSLFFAVNSSKGIKNIPIGSDGEIIFGHWHDIMLNVSPKDPETGRVTVTTKYIRYKHGDKETLDNNFVSERKAVFESDFEFPENENHQFKIGTGFLDGEKYLIADVNVFESCDTSYGGFGETDESLSFDVGGVGNNSISVEPSTVPLKRFIEPNLEYNFTKFDRSDSDGAFIFSDTSGGNLAFYDQSNEYAGVSNIYMSQGISFESAGGSKLTGKMANSNLNERTNVNIRCSCVKGSDNPDGSYRFIGSIKDLFYGNNKDETFVFEKDRYNKIGSLLNESTSSFSSNKLSFVPVFYNREKRLIFTITGVGSQMGSLSSEHAGTPEKIVDAGLSFSIIKWNLAESPTPDKNSSTSIYNPQNYGKTVFKSGLREQDEDGAVKPVDFLSGATDLVSKYSFSDQGNIRVKRSGRYSKDWTSYLDSYCGYLAPVIWMSDGPDPYIDYVRCRNNPDGYKWAYSSAEFARDEDEDEEPYGLESSGFGNEGFGAGSIDHEHAEALKKIEYFCVNEIAPIGIEEVKDEILGCYERVKCIDGECDSITGNDLVDHLYHCIDGYCEERTSGGHAIFWRKVRKAGDRNVFDMPHIRYYMNGAGAGVFQLRYHRRPEGEDENWEPTTSTKRKIFGIVRDTKITSIPFVKHGKESEGEGAISFVPVTECDADTGCQGEMPIDDEHNFAECNCSSYAGSSEEDEGIPNGTANRLIMKGWDDEAIKLMGEGDEDIPPLRTFSLMDKGFNGEWINNGGPPKTPTPLKVGSGCRINKRRCAWYRDLVNEDMLEEGKTIRAWLFSAVCAQGYREGDDGDTFDPGACGMQPCECWYIALENAPAEGEWTIVAQARLASDAGGLCPNWDDVCNPCINPETGKPYEAGTACATHHIHRDDGITDDNCHGSGSGVPENEGDPRTLMQKCFENRQYWGGAWMWFSAEIQQAYETWSIGNAQLVPYLSIECFCDGDDGTDCPDGSAHCGDGPDDPKCPEGQECDDGCCKDEEDDGGGENPGGFGDCKCGELLFCVGGYDKPIYRYTICSSRNGDTNTNDWRRVTMQIRGPEDVKAGGFKEGEIKIFHNTVDSQGKMRLDDQFDFDAPNPKPNYHSKLPHHIKRDEDQPFLIGYNWGEDWDGNELWGQDDDGKDITEPPSGETFSPCEGVDVCGSNVSYEGGPSALPNALGYNSNVVFLDDVRISKEICETGTGGLESQSLDAEAFEKRVGTEPGAYELDHDPCDEEAVSDLTGNYDPETYEPNFELPVNPCYIPVLPRCGDTLYLRQRDTEKESGRVGCGKSLGVHCRWEFARSLECLKPAASSNRQECQPSTSEQSDKLYRYRIPDGEVLAMTDDEAWETFAGLSHGEQEDAVNGGWVKHDDDNPGEYIGLETMQDFLRWVGRQFPEATLKKLERIIENNDSLTKKLDDGDDPDNAADDINNTSIEEWWDYIDEAGQFPIDVFNSALRPLEGFNSTADILKDFLITSTCLTLPGSAIKAGAEKCIDPDNMAVAPAGSFKCVPDVECCVSCCEDRTKALDEDQEAMQQAAAECYPASMTCAENDTLSELGGVCEKSSDKCKDSDGNGLGPYGPEHFEAQVIFGGVKDEHLGPIWYVTVYRSWLWEELYSDEAFAEAVQRGDLVTSYGKRIQDGTRCNPIDEDGHKLECMELIAERHVYFEAAMFNGHLITQDYEDTAGLSGSDGCGNTFIVENETWDNTVQLNAIGSLGCNLMSIASKSFNCGRCPKLDNGDIGGCNCGGETDTSSTPNGDCGRPDMGCDFLNCLAGGCGIHCYERDDNALTTQEKQDGDTTMQIPTKRVACGGKIELSFCRGACDYWWKPTNTSTDEGQLFRDRTSSSNRFGNKSLRRQLDSPGSSAPWGPVGKDKGKHGNGGDYSKPTSSQTNLHETYERMGDYHGYLMLDANPNANANAREAWRTTQYLYNYSSVEIPSIAKDEDVKTSEAAFTSSKINLGFSNSHEHYWGSILIQRVKVEKERRAPAGTDAEMQQYLTDFLFDDSGATRSFIDWIRGERAPSQEGCPDGYDFIEHEDLFEPEKYETGMCMHPDDLFEEELVEAETNPIVGVIYEEVTSKGKNIAPWHPWMWGSGYHYVDSDDDGFRDYNTGARIRLSDPVTDISSEALVKSIIDADIDWYRNAPIRWYEDNQVTVEYLEESDRWDEEFELRRQVYSGGVHRHILGSATCCYDPCWFGTTGGSSPSSFQNDAFPGAWTDYRGHLDYGLDPNIYGPRTKWNKEKEEAVVFSPDKRLYLEDDDGNVVEKQFYLFQDFVGNRQAFPVYSDPRRFGNLFSYYPVLANFSECINTNIGKDMYPFNLDFNKPFAGIPMFTALATDSNQYKLSAGDYYQEINRTECFVLEDSTFMKHEKTYDHHIAEIKMWNYGHRPSFNIFRHDPSVSHGDVVAPTPCWPHPCGPGQLSGNIYSLEGIGQASNYIPASLYGPTRWTLDHGFMGLD